MSYIRQAEKQAKRVIQELVVGALDVQLWNTQGMGVWLYYTYMLKGLPISMIVWHTEPENILYFLVNNYFGALQPIWLYPSTSSIGWQFVLNLKNIFSSLDIVATYNIHVCHELPKWWRTDWGTQGCAVQKRYNIC